jgi:hypothetical protein
MASCAAAAEWPNVVFLEPAGKVHTASAEIRENMPLYRRVAGRVEIRTVAEQSRT